MECKQYNAIYWVFEKTDASMSVLLIFDVVLSYNQLLNLKLNFCLKEEI